MPTAAFPRLNSDGSGPVDWKRSVKERDDILRKLLLTEPRMFPWPCQFAWTTLVTDVCSMTGWVSLIGCWVRCCRMRILMRLKSRARIRLQCHDRKSFYYPPRGWWATAYWINPDPISTHSTHGRISLPSCFLLLGHLLFAKAVGSKIFMCNYYFYSYQMKGSFLRVEKPNLRLDEVSVWKEKMDQSR